MLEKIIRNYTEDNIVSVSPVGEGHINDTYLVVTPASRFICQRIKSGMDTRKLEHNFKLYSEALKAAGMCFPDWLKNRDGKYYVTDENGGCWRMYPFIEGDILTAPLAKETLYACGQGLANMHMILGTIRGELQAVYPGLNDLSHYYDEYLRTINGAGPAKENRDAAIEATIESKIADMLAVTSEEMAPVHADAKLSNILFRDGRVIGFIDMDTVMQGAPIEDVADCIRSCCVRDGYLDKEAAEAIAAGYERVAGNKFTRKELKRAFDKVCFTLALRYYTDTISGGGHFREHYPGDRLDKARSLIKTTWD